MPFSFAKRVYRSAAGLTGRIQCRAHAPAPGRLLNLTGAILLASTVAGIQAADPKQTLDELMRLCGPR